MVSVLFDKQFDVVGDALVRIVRGISQKLHAVVIAAVGAIRRDSAPS